MRPVSAVIIARDEADRIAEAIRSAQAVCAEVVVLDSGSTDDTVSRAQALGARVVETDWPGHVAQKNRALEHATHDWVLSLDADERLSDELAASIREALAAPEPLAFDAFTVSRLNHWQGAPLRHGAWYPDARVRLFRRSLGRWGGMDPHDCVELPPGTRTRRLRGPLHHHPYRSLGEHLQTIERYTARHCEVALAEGRRARWWDVALRPPWHLLKALVLKRGILDGVRGLCVAGLGATYVLLKWGRLYLAQQQQTR